MWLMKAQLVVLRWAHLVSMAEHRQETSIVVGHNRRGGYLMN